MNHILLSMQRLIKTEELFDLYYIPKDLFHLVLMQQENEEEQAM